MRTKNRTHSKNSIHVTIQTNGCNSFSLPEVVEAVHTLNKVYNSAARVRAGSGGAKLIIESTEDKSFTLNSIAEDISEKYIQGPTQIDVMR